MHTDVVLPLPGLGRPAPGRRARRRRWPRSGPGPQASPSCPPSLIDTARSRVTGTPPRTTGRTCTFPGPRCRAITCSSPWPAWGWGSSCGGLCFERGEPVDGAMLLLGMGFMLLEVVGVSRASLLFGTTWAVNAYVVGAIFAMILLANLVASRYRVPVAGWPTAGLLVGVIALAVMPVTGIAALPPAAASGGRGRVPGASRLLLRPDLRDGLGDHEEEGPGPRQQPPRFAPGRHREHAVHGGGLPLSHVPDPRRLPGRASAAPEGAGEGRSIGPELGGRAAAGELACGCERPASAAPARPATRAPPATTGGNDR